MTYKQGEVVIVPFPFSDLSSFKRRPVLVMSNNDYNAKADDIVVCGITSVMRDQPYSIVFDNEDLMVGEIPKMSRIKADKFFTIKQTKVVKSIALVSEKTLNKTKDEMLRLFAF